MTHDMNLSDNRAPPRARTREIEILSKNARNAIEDEDEYDDEKKNDD